MELCTSNSVLMRIATLTALLCIHMLTSPCVPGPRTAGAPLFLYP